MLKLRSISKLEFDNYVKKQQNTHFMHSTSWGEFEKVTNNITPHYLGLTDEDNQIIAATLLLEEHLPLNASNLYAPRGYIIDYSDKRLLKIFTNKLRDFAKTRKATSIRINPSLTDKSNELNSFYFLDGEYVLDKNTRVGLTRRIEAEKANEFTKTKVWLEEVTSKEMMCLNINIEVFEKFLNSLEVYAAQCFDATNTILGVIKQKQDIEELNQFDYKSYYPEKLTLKV